MKIDSLTDKKNKACIRMLSEQVDVLTAAQDENLATIAKNMLQLAKLEEEITQLRQQCAELEKELQHSRAATERAHDRELQRWIPVSERVPHKKQNVVACDSKKKVIYVLSGLSVLGSRSITHWMPLPEPPEGE